MNTRYLEKSGPIGTAAFPRDRAPYPSAGIIMSVVNNYYGVAFVRVSTLPPELLGQGRNEEYSSYFWFNDRAGWKVAYRWARKIARGRRLDGLDTENAPRGLRYEIASHHWDSRPAAIRIVQKEGVVFEGVFFTSLKLTPYAGQVVGVRASSNMSVVSVFTLGGKFLCRAESRPDFGTSEVPYYLSDAALAEAGARRQEARAARVARSRKHATELVREISISTVQTALIQAMLRLAEERAWSKDKLMTVLGIIDVQPTLEEMHIIHSHPWPAPAPEGGAA